jgi:hypothetical protein
MGLGPMIAVLLVFFLGPIGCKRRPINAYRSQNLSRIAVLIERYARANDNRLPRTLSDFWSLEDKSVLADVFWPDWAEEFLGDRPDGWPATPLDLDIGGGYLRWCGDRVGRNDLIVIERHNFQTGVDGGFIFAVDKERKVVAIRLHEIPKGSSESRLADP